MSIKKLDPDDTYLALKYPGFYSWRDLDAAMARGGFWENGDIIRLSDPEMKPRMDELTSQMIDDPGFAHEMLQSLYDKSAD